MVERDSEITKTKIETINEIKEWVKENMQDKEVDGAIIESIHASGQENIAIYTADDDTLEQTNGINTDHPTTKTYKIEDSQNK